MAELMGELTVDIKYLSLRDYFAGQALAGYRSSEDDNSVRWSAVDVAKRSYEDADAMLEARKK